MTRIHLAADHGGFDLGRALQARAGAAGFDVVWHGTEQVDPEAPRDAKGWLRQRMSGGVYSAMIDQPAFAARFSLQQAFDGSRSFRKLCKEWDCCAGV